MFGIEWLGCSKLILCFALPQHCKTYRAARKKKRKKGREKKVSYIAKYTGNSLWYFLFLLFFRSPEIPFIYIKSVFFFFFLKIWPKRTRQGNAKQRINLERPNVCNRLQSQSEARIHVSHDKWTCWSYDLSLSFGWAI